MGTSVSILLRKRKRRDGTYPLALRIYKNNATSYVHIGVNLTEKDWDAKKQKVKSSHPNFVRVNNLLAKKIAEATNTALEVDTTENHATASSILYRVNAPYKGKGFNALADDYLKSLEQNYNRYTAEKPRIERFKEFVQNDISLESITPALLIKFQTYLNNTRNISERTVVNHLIVIRSIINLAIKSDLIDKKHYPFGRGKVVIKFPETTKIGLTQEEVGKLINIELDPASFEAHARNIWMFSFYLAGIRVSDVLRLEWDNIIDGRLYYTMGKNNKSGSFKLPEKALLILTQYRTQKNKHNLVFPDLNNVKDLTDTFDTQRKIKQALKDINAALDAIAKEAKITKKVSMHISRHTFGNLSGDKIPIQMLQRLYRHSSITTTIDYQKNFVFKDTDEALDAVINF